MSCSPKIGAAALKTSQFIISQIVEYYHNDFRWKIQQFHLIILSTVNVFLWYLFTFTRFSIPLYTICHGYDDRKILHLEQTNNIFLLLFLKDLSFSWDINLKMLLQLFHYWDDEYNKYINQMKTSSVIETIIAKMHYFLLSTLQSSCTNPNYWRVSSILESMILYCSMIPYK